MKIVYGALLIFCFNLNAMQKLPDRAKVKPQFEEDTNEDVIKRKEKILCSLVTKMALNGELRLPSYCSTTQDFAQEIKNKEKLDQFFDSKPFSEDRKIEFERKIKKIAIKLASEGLLQKGSRGSERSQILSPKSRNKKELLNKENDKYNGPITVIWPCRHESPLEQEIYYFDGVVMSNRTLARGYSLSPPIPIRARNSEEVPRRVRKQPKRKVPSSNNLYKVSDEKLVFKKQSLVGPMKTPLELFLEDGDMD